MTQPSHFQLKASLVFPLVLGSLIVALLASIALGLRLTVDAGIVSVTFVVFLAWIANPKNETLENWRGSHVIGRLAPAVFAGLFSVALLIRHTEVQRSALDIVVLASMWICLLLQALLGAVDRSYSPAIVAETTIAAAFAMFSVNLLYPVYNGQRDFLIHSSITDFVLATGALPPNTVYAYFPVLQILAATFSMVLGAPTSTALPVIVGFAMILTLPLLYRTARRYIGNPRIATLAIIMFASSVDFQTWSKFAVPTALGFVLAFYTFCYAATPTLRIQHRIVAMVFLAATLLTHILASSLLVAMLILSLLAGLVSHRKAGRSSSDNGATVTFTGLTIVAMLGYWGLLALIVFKTYVPLVNAALEAPQSVSGGFNIALGASFLRSLATVILGMLYLVGLALVARSHLLRRNSRLVSVFAVSLLFPMSLVPSMESYALASGSGLAVYRWSLFAMPSVGIIVGILFASYFRRSGKVVLAVMLSIALCFGTAVSSFDVNSTWSGTSFGVSSDFFSAAEVSAAQFVHSKVAGPISTDFSYSALFLYDLDPGRTINYAYQSFMESSGVHVIRTSELSNRGLRFTIAGGSYSGDVVIGGAGYDLDARSIARIYDNGDVVVDFWP